MDTKDEIRFQRRQEAENKKIYVKAVEIARRLGETTQKNHGAYHIYEESLLRIQWDDFGPNLWIEWNGKTVYYHQINDLRAYRPDIDRWEQSLNEIYGRLEPILRKEADAAERERDEAFFDTWGIRPG